MKWTQQMSMIGGEQYVTRSGDYEYRVTVEIGRSQQCYAVQSRDRRVDSV